MDFQHKTTKETRVAYAAFWSGALFYARSPSVAKLWVLYLEKRPEALIDKESNHLRYQSLNLGVAYSQCY